MALLKGFEMLTLAQAESIIDAALACGKKLSLAPLTVVVVDTGGHVIASKRGDGSGFFRNDIAFAKAWGAIGFCFSSRELADRSAKIPHFFSALHAVSQGRLAPSPGGLIIAAADGAYLGAVGISGDTGDNDEKCAVEGIRSVGLRAVGVAP
jgi:uncharacterized protein GlcG (DUF336 family)